MGGGGNEALVEERGRREQQFQIGQVESVVAAHEAVGLGDVRGEHAAAAHQVVHQRRHLLRGEERVRLHSVPQGRDQVVEQVRPHLGHVAHHLDAVLAQVGRGADAGEHEQLGRVDGAAGEDDFAPGADHLASAVALVLHPDGAGSVEHHPSHQGLGDHVEVGPRRRRTQVGVRAAEAGTPLLRHHRLCHALGRRQVGALGGQTERRRRLEVRRGDRPGAALGGHAQGAAAPLVVLGRPLEVLDAPEHLDRRLEGPVRTGRLGPLVVVRGEPAHPHHGVERGRSAQHLPARPEDAAAGESGLRFGVVVPIQFGAKQFREARGNVDELVLVLRPGLEHDHVDVRGCTEPVRQHAARGSGTDDDVVRDAGGVHHGSSLHSAHCPGTRNRAIRTRVRRGG